MAAPTINIKDIDNATRRWQAAGHAIRRATLDVYEINPDDPMGEPCWFIHFDDDERMLSTREMIAQAPKPAAQPLLVRPRHALPVNGGNAAPLVASAQAPLVAPAQTLATRASSAELDVMKFVAEAMKPPERLPLAMIRRDGGTQPRAALDDEVIDEYAESMRAGAAFPPVVVFHDGTEYWLADGFHRVNAALRLGLTDIAVDMRQGSIREAILFSVGANASHGLRRSNADKRRAIERLLRDPEWAKWSDSEIARRCAVDHKTVATARFSLGNSQVRNDERTYLTKHGTPATMNTAAIGAQTALVSGQSDQAHQRNVTPRAEVWEIERALWLWLRQRYPDLHDQETVLSGLVQHKSSFQPAWGQVMEVLPVHNRSDGIQAISNALELVQQTLRQQQEAQAPLVSSLRRNDRPAQATVVTREAPEPGDQFVSPAEIGKVTIYQGDARQVLQSVAGPVHLVITSPPYNTGGIIAYDGHADNLDQDDYDNLLEDVWRRCVDVLAPGGRLCINVPFGMGRSPWVPVTPAIYRQLASAGLDIEGQIVWDKGTSGNSTAWGSWGRPSNPVLRDTCEAIIVAVKPGQSVMPREILVRTQPEPSPLVSPWLTEDGLFMQLTQDHWQIAPESASRIGHPAPFPVKLAENLLRLYAWPGATVLDPFAGSGTVGVAALSLPGGDRCQVVMIEQSALYCTVAQRRIEAAKITMI